MLSNAVRWPDPNAWWRDGLAREIVTNFYLRAWCAVSIYFTVLSMASSKMITD